MSFVSKIFAIQTVRTLARSSATRWTSSAMSCQPRRFVQTSPGLSSKEEVTVTFVRSGGEKMVAKGKVGDNLLDIIVDNDIDLDGYGACEGTLACSTCHLIFKPEDYAKLGEPPTDEELDMLDLAYGLTDTSRLGCQVCMTKELSGIEVKVPEGVHDQRNA